MENIDNTEIKKFSDLAAQWWDTEGDFKTLHAVNPLRMQFISSRVNLSAKQVIDVGCGGGILSEAMSQAGAIVTGIDMAEASLKVANLHKLATNLKIDYQQTTAEEMAKKQPGSFDVVTCLEMLEHVPDPQSTVQACADLAKPNGDIFFSTLNRNIKSYLQAILGAEYILKLIPKGTHDYAKFIKPSELCRCCRESNLQVLDMTGIQYNPITKEYKLSESVAANYLLHAKKNG